MPDRDLTDDELRNFFEYVVSREPSYEDTKDEIAAELRDSGETDDARTRIDNGIRQARSHDNLLESTISVFLPNGQVNAQTDWRFLGAEPLSELGVPNADLIIGNPERNFAVIVECKSGLSRPGKALNQLYDAADALREHQPHLEERIGMPIDQFECALSISSTDDIRLVREIEQHERDGRAQEKVFVWRLHYLENGEQIDLFTRIETREPGKSTHDNELAQILSGGIDITNDEHLSPSFFPSSHLYRIMEEVFSTILTQRKIEDGPMRHFAGKEVLDILTSQRHLPHYDADEIGTRIYEELISRLLDFKLIVSISPSDTQLTGDGEFYRYKGRGRSMSTILNDLQDGYKSAAVEQEIELEAMRRTIEQYEDEQSRLGDY
ncbi:hypothetical protein [Halomarina ordinaria]|uniref:Restriction endonuclease n=1 Tax=Halomarina ordinaria TaxID=3033939 RepID=A0ABD5UFJ7_9EURY|nr:hypothetical protein [Halomarina sp. PSRA2]